MRRGTQVVQKKRRTSIVDKKSEEVGEDEHEKEGKENEVVTVVAEEVEVGQDMAKTIF
jgi:hypothetical protein